MKRRLVLLGAPGAGKGTQAKRLAESTGLAHLSTGDLLRAAVAAGTPAGREASAHMQAGRLVPDEVVFGVLFERLQDAEQGFVLDGFPRNRAQAEELDRRLAEAGHGLEAVIDVEVPDSQLVRRITGRRICKGCGRNYHVEFVPSKVAGRCDACGGELSQRADDTAAVVTERLTVDGTRTVDQVGAAIVAALGAGVAGAARHH